MTTSLPSSDAFQAAPYPDRSGGMADVLFGLHRIVGNAGVGQIIARQATIRRLATLRAGAEGQSVRQLQTRLNAATPAPVPPLHIDGIFGKRTAAAVRAFQERHGLDPDAVVGSKTWRALGLGSDTPKSHAKAPAAAAHGQEPATSSTGGIAAAVGTVVEKALNIAADQPEAGLPGGFVEQQLAAAFKEFAEVPVTVRGTAEHPVVPPRIVRVHTPYFINVNAESAEMSKKVHAAAMEARHQKAVRAFFDEVAKDEQLSGPSDRALVGKASPKNIQDILQAALDRGIITPQDAEHPTGDELRIWLRTHGVGVDCSGFVSQALTRVVEHQFHASGQQGPVKEIYHGSAGLKGGTGEFAKVGSDKTCKGPKCLAAGDTMYIPGHIRILASVTRRDGGVEFVTYESYGGGKERTGLAQAKWFYPSEDAFTGLQLKRGDKPWKPSKEQPVYGRHRALVNVGNTE